MPLSESQQVAVQAGGRHFDIEFAWVGPFDAGASPPLVFLHEGLGSVSMWRDFPQRLCDVIGRRGLVYSRPGYGRSTPRPPHEHWSPDFMQVQADVVLPALLQALGVEGRYLLFGHSDGATIALIHAALHPARVEAVVALAPHILVEDISIASIAAARQAYLEGGLRERLQRHHGDVDSAFYGWADAWLSPAFRDWTIEPLLHRIGSPMLVMQGLDDEYGTLAQVEGIARAAPQTLSVVLPGCGHSPQRGQPEQVMQTVQAWMRSNSGHD